MENPGACLPPPTSAVKEWRRFRALELRRQGWKHREIAEALGVTRGAVSQWLGYARTQGVEALRYKKRYGPKPKLSPEQWQQVLQQMLPRGAEAFGFQGNAWTLPRIATLISREFGVRYHPDWLSCKMRSLGWSVQRPEPQDIKAGRREPSRRGWAEAKGGKRIEQEGRPRD